MVLLWDVGTEDREGPKGGTKQSGAKGPAVTGCIVAGRKLSGQKMTPRPNTHSTHTVQQKFLFSQRIDGPWESPCPSVRPSICPPVRWAGAKSRGKVQSKSCILRNCIQIGNQVFWGKGGASRSATFASLRVSCSCRQCLVLKQLVLLFGFGSVLFPDILFVAPFVASVPEKSSLRPAPSCADSEEAESQSKSRLFVGLFGWSRSSRSLLLPIVGLSPS